VCPKTIACRYGLVDRKCGVPMPGDNLVCSKARLRMCLRTPGVREAAIRQKKDADDAAARLEQVGEVSLGEQYGVASRHGAVRLSLSLRQIGTSQPARPASQSASQLVAPTC
jgi:hypothetical protein